MLNFQSVKEMAFLPDRSLDSFRKLTGINGSTYVIMKKIETEYSRANAEGTQKIELKKDGVDVQEISQANRIYITTDIDSINDKSRIVLVFAPNRNPNKQPWELQNVTTENEFHSDFYLELGDHPKNMLWNYAYWPTYTEDLKKLKNNIALKENWSYKQDPPDDEFPILKNYINYTFSKLWLDKQIYFSIDGRYSVFNTGLVSKNYQYIYALFEQFVGGTKPWKFNMFCIPGIKAGSRILNDNFKELPHPAHYFNNISDISYIIDSNKSPDEQLPDLQPEHYLIDRIDRLPMHYLIDSCRKNSELVELLNQDAESFSSKKEVNEHWEKIRDLIREDPDVYNDLESSFRSAVRKAVMRVSWNYRTAIPVYFPSYNKMSILLPLSFSVNSDAETALVVEKSPVSERYTAPTILSLPLAYSNARLVCKPESDWLNQRILEPLANNDDETCDDADED